MKLSPSLDAVDAMLLATDGSATTLLEASTHEPIVLATLRESGPAGLEVLLAEVGEWWHPRADALDLSPHEEVVVRRRILRGGRTHRPYLLADWLFVPGRLPEVAGQLLDPGPRAIGRLLTKSEVEARREILDMGWTRAGEAAEHLSCDPSALLVWRTYRVIIRSRPVVLMTEFLVPGRLAESASNVRRLGVPRHTAPELADDYRKSA